MTPGTCLLEIYKTDRKATVSQGRVGASRFTKLSPISGIFDKGISACHRQGNIEKKEHLGPVLGEVGFSRGPRSHPRGCRGEIHLCSGRDKNRGKILILTRELFNRSVL